MSNKWTAGMAGAAFLATASMAQAEIITTPPASDFLSNDISYFSCTNTDTGARATVISAEDERGKTGKYVVQTTKDSGIPAAIVMQGRNDSYLEAINICAGRSFRLTKRP